MKTNFKTTDAHRDEVKFAIAAGGTETEIARLIGISVEQLKHHFAHELEFGLRELNYAVMRSLYRMAISGDPEAMEFWLMNRANWKARKRTSPQPQDK